MCRSQQCAPAHPAHGDVEVAVQDGRSLRNSLLLSFYALCVQEPSKLPQHTQYAAIVGVTVQEGFQRDGQDRERGLWQRVQVRIFLVSSTLICNQARHAFVCPNQSMCFGNKLGSRPKISVFLFLRMDGYVARVTQLLDDLQYAVRTVKLPPLS